jgi:hypothetical protein
VITLAEDMQQTSFADEKTYLLPVNVQAIMGSRQTETQSLKVESGDEMARELDTSTSASGSYSGFSASASAQYSYSTSLSHSKYYALIDVVHTSFSLELKGHESIDSRINSDLVEDAKKLPEWEETDEVHRQYLKFFRKWGTHVIKSCTFGARYRLRVDEDMSKFTSKETFQTCVSTEFSFVGSAKADAKIRTTSEYESYHSSRHFRAKVDGGSSSSNLILSQEPDNSEKYAAAFREWANSLDNTLSSNVINARLDSVGNLLQNSSVEEHRAVSGKLIKALEYLASMRVCEGFLKIDARRKPTDPTFARGLQISGGPGIMVKGGSQGAFLKVLMKLDAFPGFQIDRVQPLQGTVREIPPISLEVYVKHPSAIGELNMETLLQLASAPLAGQLAIDIYVPIWILAPPTPVRVKLSVLSGDATTTELDLSPGGPTLTNGVVLFFPPSKEYTFPATSLFVPTVHSAPLNIGLGSNAELAQLANIALTVNA